MDKEQPVEFVRQRGLAVVATRDAHGKPQAALVGAAATEQGEIVFDTLTSSRKYRNINSHPRVALVIGWDDEVTLQCEGVAELPLGEDLDRCLAAYFEQYPDGRQRAASPDITHVRVRPGWLRYSDYRPASFTIEEFELPGPAGTP
jgi:PPOX class probable F420-dependent enzyme